MKEDLGMVRDCHCDLLPGVFGKEECPVSDSDVGEGLMGVRMSQGSGLCSKLSDGESNARDQW